MLGTAVGAGEERPEVPVAPSWWPQEISLTGHPMMRERT